MYEFTNVVRDFIEIVTNTEFETDSMIYILSSRMTYRWRCLENRIVVL